MEDYDAHLTMQAALASTKAWLKRKRDKHNEPMADEVWARIRSKWPRLPETYAERVFQAVA